MLTIMISTKNRSDFLYRALSYYQKERFSGKIIIADSSTGHHLEQTKLNIELLRNDLNIFHYEFPNLNEPQSTQKLVQMLDTPYGAWVADDDFLIPSGLKDSIAFLELNPDYSSAAGKCLRITIKDFPLDFILIVTLFFFSK